VSSELPQGMESTVYGGFAALPLYFDGIYLQCGSLDWQDVMKEVGGYLATV
jgi:hypothetical protein